MSEAATVVAAADRLLVDRRQMSYETDQGVGAKARIGVIVLGTDQTLEHEFRLMLRMPGVAFFESRLHNDANISAETLRAMERDITQATRLIVPNAELDVVAYACTSGATMIGEPVVHRRIRDARPTVACTTPMEASCAALGALGARRVALLTPYVDDINRHMRRYLLERGFEVPVQGSWNIADDGLVARITPRSIREAVLELGASDAVDTVFVACTSLRVAELVQDLEHVLGKPVTASNHSLAWHCLRLAGYAEPVAGFGRLFELGLDGGVLAGADS